MIGQPAVADHNCSADMVCLWDYADFTVLLTSRAGDGGLANIHVDYRDKTAAWGNDTVHDGCLYDEPSGSIVLDELDSYSSDYFNIDRRDRAESWKTNGSC